MEQRPEREKKGSKYSIIIPTYNERVNIALITYLIFKHLRDVDFEIIVVDDGSPDGTQDVVKQLQQVYGEDHILLRARPRKLGLGTAYRHGLKHASGDFVVIMDADLSHHPKYLPEFIRSRSTSIFFRYMENVSVSNIKVFRRSMFLITERKSVLLHVIHLQYLFAGKQVETGASIVTGTRYVSDGDRDARYTWSDTRDTGRRTTDMFGRRRATAMTSCICFIESLL